MKWEQMQKPLRDGNQVFRRSWPDSAYVIVEDDPMVVIYGDDPECRVYVPSDADLSADDWAATGPSGE